MSRQRMSRRDAASPQAIVSRDRCLNQTHSYSRRIYCAAVTHRLLMDQRARPLLSCVTTPLTLEYDHA